MTKIPEILIQYVAQLLNVHRYVAIRWIQVRLEANDAY